MIALAARRMFAVHPTSRGGVVALQGLSLVVERGEFLALLGPSGSGKTTLLRCLAGVHRPLAGELHGFGMRLHDATPRALTRWRSAHVGIVGQRYLGSLSPDLTAIDVVTMRATLRGSVRSVARHEAHALLERVGLGDRAEARRHELSGGEQQRLALCAALHSRPSLLLGDEVTGELDDANGAAVLELLRDLARDHGTTVVLVTHDPHAAAVADRAVTMRDGRVTATVDATGGRRVMVEDSGLLRLEPEDLAISGIVGAAAVHVAPGRVVVRAVGPASKTVAAPAFLPKPAARHAAAGVVLRGAHRRYGDTEAIRPTDLAIHEPGLHVVVGPSGSGKTTLLHLVGGLERPSGGSISVAGIDLVPLSRAELARFRRRNLAIVPQAAALTAHLTARENVDLALRIRGGDRAAGVRALSAVGLGELMDRRAGELSGGEQQRVAIARALAGGAPVVLADEPTASLDQRNAIAIAQLLHDVAHSTGAIIVCATHDHSVIARADTVIELVAGGVARAA
jgi:ABC-type lipoprotein export system ATPase subunit